MCIKYKGTTSQLLTDLSQELKKPVDLKLSEAIMSNFFRRALKDMSLEKSIEIVSQLPSSLKPFCHSKNEYQAYQSYFANDQLNNTIEAVFKILIKYVPAEKLAVIYSCFPESLFISNTKIKKEVLIPVR